MEQFSDKHGFRSVASPPPPKTVLLTQSTGISAAELLRLRRKSLDQAAKGMEFI